MNAQRTFEANRNTDKESQAVFILDWLGATGEKVSESHKCSEADKEM